MSTRRLASLLLLLAGCQATEPFELPDLGAARTLVVAIDAGNHFELSAYAVESGQPMPPLVLAASKSRGTDLFLLSYDLPLEALGLSAGPIGGASCPLLPPARFQHGRLASGPARFDPPESDPAKLPTGLGGPPCQGPDLCGPFRQKVEALRPALRNLPCKISALAKLEDDVAVAATEDGQLFRIRRTETATLGALAHRGTCENPAEFFTSAYQADDGTIWFSDDVTGQLSHLDPAHPPPVLRHDPTTADRGDAIVAIDGGMSVGGTEIFGITYNGRVRRFVEDRGWTFTSSAGPELSGPEHKRRVLWRSPRHAIVAQEGPGLDLVDADAGTVETFFFPNQPPGLAEYVGTAPALGLLAAFGPAQNLPSTLLVADPSTLLERKSFGRAVLPNGVTALAPIGGGLLIGGGNSTLTYWSPESGVCTASIPLKDANRIIAVGENVAVISGDPLDRTQVWVYWLDLGN